MTRTIVLLAMVVLLGLTMTWTTSCDAAPSFLDFFPFVPKEVSRVTRTREIRNDKEKHSAVWGNEMSKEKDSETIEMGKSHKEKEDSKNPNPILASKLLIFPCPVGQVYSKHTRKCRGQLIRQPIYGTIG